MENGFSNAKKFWPAIAAIGAVIFIAALAWFLPRPEKQELIPLPTSIPFMNGRVREIGSNFIMVLPQAPENGTVDRQRATMVFWDSETEILQTIPDAAPDTAKGLADFLKPQQARRAAPSIFHSGALVLVYVKTADLGEVLKNPSSYQAPAPTLAEAVQGQLPRVIAASIVVITSP